MSFEQEFSIEILDEKADKLTCCTDIAKYIVSGAEHKVAENSLFDFQFCRPFKVLLKDCLLWFLDIS
ncbi:hypothetical protein I3843_08G083300 [Carya illinoinensis]|nr:hypothetical protein I3843_08G083300 [Carya illinoinensis]